MRPVSSGSRSASSAGRGNSGSSSRKSSPPWASEISPGRGGDPPPTSATADAVLRYRGRISGPLLDRIDLQVEVPAVAAEVLAAAPDGEPTASVASRVAAARQRALERQGGRNAELGGNALDAHAALDIEGTRFLRSSAARLGWSARGFHRVLRVARTIADLAACATIRPEHLAEAIQYRRVLSPTYAAA